MIAHTLPLGRVRGEGGRVWLRHRGWMEAS